MAHVFFFNYAHENRDKQLEAFFEDLCAEVAPYTPWAADDLRISFRDGQNLALMQEWRPALSLPCNRLGVKRGYRVTSLSV